MASSDCSLVLFRYFSPTVSYACTLGFNKMLLGKFLRICGLLFLISMFMLDYYDNWISIILNARSISLFVLSVKFFFFFFSSSSSSSSKLFTLSAHFWWNYRPIPLSFIFNLTIFFKLLIFDVLSFPFSWQILHSGLSLFWLISLVWSIVCLPWFLQLCSLV